MTHDVEIIDILDQEDPQEYTGTLWRTTWMGRSPIRGGFGGGRWSPARRFETLYTSLDKNASIHELHHHLSQAPIFSSSKVDVSELSVDNLEILDLTSERLLIALGLHGKPASDILPQCQKIGAAAYFLDAHGIIVPSYRSDASHCVIFPDKIDPETLHVVDTEEINWPAWIQANIRRGNNT